MRAREGHKIPHAVRESQSELMRETESQKESQREHKVFKYFVRTSPRPLSKFMVSHPENDQLVITQIRGDGGRP